MRFKSSPDLEKKKEKRMKKRRKDGKQGVAKVGVGLFGLTHSGLVAALGPEWGTELERGGCGGGWQRVG